MRLVSCLLLAGFLLAGCVDAPRQSVELSATVGRDLNEMQRAHRELARRYFARAIQDVNAFVDGKYRPYVINYVVADPQLRLRERLEEALRPGAQSDPAAIMGRFANLIIADIEDYRRQLLEPVERERDDMLASLDAAYQQLHAANAAVTAHLASAAKVNDAQDRAFAELGLAGFRERAIGAAASFSERIDALTREGARIDAGAADAGARFQELVAEFRKLRQ